MLLAFDVGNRTVAAGLFQGDRLLLDFRLSSDAGLSAEEYAAAVLARLEGAGYGAVDVDAAAVASVVPAVSRAVCAGVSGNLHVEPYLIGTSSTYDIENRYNKPELLGVDRLVNASAAWRRLHKPCIVVDFGTATTVDAIADGAFIGGAILPGPKTAAGSLGRTALVGQVELSPPSRAIGRDTAECVSSGVLFGLAAAVDSLVERFAGEMGLLPVVIATGGDAGLVVPFCERVDEVIPTLTLEGVALVWALNNPPKTLKK